MDKKQYGVHQSHCCVLHGCKYGDAICPVVNGEVKQDYPCESCDDIYEHNTIAKELYEALSKLKACSSQPFTDEQAQRKFIAIGNAEDVLKRYEMIFDRKRDV